MKEILLSVKCQFQNVWSLIREDFSAVIVEIGNLIAAFNYLKKWLKIVHLTVVSAAAPRCLWHMNIQVHVFAAVCIIW